MPQTASASHGRSTACGSSQGQWGALTWQGGYHMDMVPNEGPQQTMPDRDQAWANTQDSDETQNSGHIGQYVHTSAALQRLHARGILRPEPAQAKQ